MPTGYTAAIEKGITFEDFVCSCAKAFGACVTMRDDPSDAPLPDEFKPSDYHVKALDEAKSRVYDLMKMTKDECAKEAAKEWQEEEQGRIDALAKIAALHSQYQAMLAKVNAWKPPTTEHEGLKAFMVQQIADSMKWDCDGSYYQEPRKKLTPLDWHRKAVQAANKDVEYHMEKLVEEKNRCKDRTEWVKQLKQSLGVAPNGVTHN